MNMRYSRARIKKGNLHSLSFSVNPINVVKILSLQDLAFGNANVRVFLLLISAAGMASALDKIWSSDKRNFQEQRVLAGWRTNTRIYTRKHTAPWNRFHTGGGSGRAGL